MGETAVDAEVEPEEVQPADTLEFPSADYAQQESSGFGTTELLAIAGVVSGLAGLILSLFNMRKSH